MNTMKDRLTEESLKYIIARVLEYANDALKENDDNDFLGGKKLAYIEVLNCIQNELIIHEMDLKEFGLDIDVINSIYASKPKGV